MREIVAGLYVSADGVGIAYDKRGEGPAVILVDGALYSRAAGPTRSPRSQRATSDHR